MTGRDKWFYGIAGFVIVVDQLGKWLIRSHFTLGETMPLWNHLLTLTYYENSGMARSLFQGYARLFMVMALLFVAGVMYYRKQGSFRGGLMDAGMAFLVGGALGNAIDRLLFGKVTDFLVFREGHGVLNLADLAINAGILLVIADIAVQMIKNAIYKRGGDRYNKP
ncbi:signal peptidase II [Paenibacillus thalictri]|uniref:Lipoprotein signal peptidase n=1 Tax=Paenibacillus thalictri TaxID=2527873 RepID=A0A4Q9DRW6_9BACL|nr:signal peptidase II [Paenibacillus thalictri]TBL78625.1 signal peptidase II [Paenibacillus thalictri]